MVKRLVTLSLAFGLVACGGDDAEPPDALHGTDSAVSDASPGTCDYTEADDDGNAITAEVTGLGIGGGIKICGSIAARSPSAGTVDTDRYQFTVNADGPFLVRVDAPAGGVAVIHAGVSLAAGGDGSFRGDGVYVGDHLVFFAELEAGDFVVEVDAADQSAPAGPLPYQLTIASDAPATRCASITGNAAYTETNDTSTNTGNDMVEVTWAPFGASQTAATTDAPEPSASALTISAGMVYKALGTADLPNGGDGDLYQDRDTYLIATGAETNELAVRLAWDGTDADLDVVLFAKPIGTDPPIPVAFGTLNGQTAPEFATTAALRSTPYWLWVGEFDSQSPVSKSYELTICGYAYATR